MKLISKAFVFIGTFIVFAANSYALWSFFSAFSAMRNSETAGIGRFAAAIDSAYHGVLFSFAGIFLLFIGCILLLIPAKQRVNAA